MRVVSWSDDVLDLNIDVWRLNATAFEGSGCVIADLPESARRTFSSAGRDLDESIEDLCRWHAETLESFVFHLVVE